MEGIEQKLEDSQKQVENSLPLLKQLGYEVTSFKVAGGGWGLLPWAKLCLRSNVTPGTQPLCDNTTEIDEIKGKSSGWLATALVSSAAAAKKIQCSTPIFETLVIEIDVAMPPKIKTSYTKLSIGTKEPPEPYIESLDPACGQANSGK